MSLAFGSDLRRPLPAAGDAFDETRVLGGALVGDPSASRSPWPWPAQAVLAPVLGDTRVAVEERWTADGDCLAGKFAGIAFRRSRDILFGVIELVSGLTGRTGIAHFAHLGGMLGGWLMIRYWRGQPPFPPRVRRR